MAEQVPEIRVPIPPQIEIIFFLPKKKLIIRDVASLLSIGGNWKNTSKCHFNISCQKSNVILQNCIEKY